MIRISVWNPKGGVGKTLLSINIAGAVLHSGKSVLLADLDPQFSAKRLARDGNLQFEVVNNIPKNDCADVLIMDHPPGYTELPKAQFVIFPMRFSRTDMEAGIEALKALNHAKYTKTIVVFNAVDFRRGVDRSTFNRARKLKPFVDAKLVKSRNIYRAAMDQGRSIYDSKLNRYHAVDLARLEIQHIFKK